MTLTGQRVQIHDNPFFECAFRRFVCPGSAAFRDCPASTGTPDGTRRPVQCRTTESRKIVDGNPIRRAVMQFLQARSSNEFRRFAYFFRCAKQKILQLRLRYSRIKYQEDISVKFGIERCYRKSAKIESNRKHPESIQLFVHRAGFEKTSMPVGAVQTVNYALEPDGPKERCPWKLSRFP